MNATLVSLLSLSLFALAPGSAASDPEALGRRLGIRVHRIGRVGAGPGIVGLPRPSAGHHF